MRTVTVERVVDAPTAAVWAVLADYPNIDQWNEGVKKSRALGDLTAGVGAQRHCALAPDGKMGMRETVTEWVDERRMVIDIDEIEKMPINGATMTFTLADGTAATTAFTMRYDYDPKGGPLAFVFGPLMDRQMQKGFNGFVDFLEPEAQARSTST